MSFEISRDILAVVTPDKELVAGGAPVFVAQGEDKMAELAEDLARVLHADAVRLRSGIYLIIPVKR